MLPAEGWGSLAGLSPAGQLLACPPLPSMRAARPGSSQPRLGPHGRPPGPSRVWLSPSGESSLLGLELPAIRLLCAHALPPQGQPRSHTGPLPQGALTSMRPLIPGGPQVGARVPLLP